MKNNIYIICGTILLCMIWTVMLCLYTPSAVLTPFTKQMLDMYVSAGWADGERIAITVDRIDERYIYFFMNTPPNYAPIYGTYCGATHHRGHEIIVYGNSVDGLFWSSSIPPREIDTSEEYFYMDHRGFWYIEIDLLDTTVVPEKCVFENSFPYPIDTINRMLRY